MRTAAVALLLTLAFLSPGLSEEPAPAPALGLVTLHWPEHDLSQAQVRVFRDAARQDLVEAFPATNASGRVILTVPPGTYYLTAVVDLDKNGTLTPGDGLGFSGVLDPAQDRPAPVVLKDQASAVWLPISLVMEAGGKLAPTGVTRPEAAERGKMVLIAGTVTGGAADCLQIAYAVPKSGQGPSAAALIDKGSFSLQISAGEYYLFAVEDTNRTEKVDAGDAVAVHGYGPEQGRLFPTTSFSETTAGLPLALKWRLSDTGLLTAGEVEGPQTAPETIPAVLFGSIPGLPADQVATIRATLDERFTQDAGLLGTSAGRFALALPAGTYFLSVMADADGDGKPSAGDGIGFYGVSNLRLGHGPQPLRLGGGEFRSLDLLLCGRLDEHLRPVALP